MSRLKDLTGMKFGRLTVVERSSNDKQGKTQWLCKCECGNEKVIRGSHLRSGQITSCGCYNKERMKKQNEKMWKDEEYRKIKSEKARERMKEMWKDEEYRKIKSEKMKKQNEKMWKDEEYRQIQREKIKDKWQNEEFRKMQSEKMKEKWKDEEFRKMQSEKMMSGEKHHNWKGGITPISTYLRVLNEQWFKDCKQQTNYTCELTGKVGGNLHTHHLKAFNTIVLEAHELYNIEIHEIIGEYTQEELHKLEEYVASWHKDNSNAVVLCEVVHDLFHNLYGYGNNTKEQFEEFKQRYLNGEFQDLLGDVLNI